MTEIDNLYNKYNLGGLLTAFPLNVNQTYNLEKILNEIFSKINTLSYIEKENLIKKIDLIKIIKKASPIKKNNTLKGGRGGRGSSSRSSRGFSTGAHTRGRTSNRENKAANQQANEQAKFTRLNNWKENTNALFEQINTNEKPNKQAAKKALSKIIDTYKEPDTTQLIFRDDKPNYVLPQSRNPYLNMSMPHASFYHEPGGVVNVPAYFDELAVNPNPNFLLMADNPVGLTEKILVVVYILCWVGTFKLGHNILKSIIG